MNLYAEAEGLEPPSQLITDQRFSRAPDYQLSHTSEIDTLGLHSTTLPTLLDKIRLIVKAEREGFEPPDPLLSFYVDQP